jgi:glycosyltransferase involved in cell wall biosynthesis
MAHLPKVTVITVVLNNRKFIRTCIESVLGQSYPNIEYIVKDGGSSDGTQTIVKEYGDAITLINEPDRGMYDGLNQAIHLATGDIIALLNADDFYTGPEVVAHMVRAMEETDADAAWGDLIFVDRRNLRKVVRRWKSAPYGPGKMKKGWHPPHPTFFVRRHVYEKYGGFRTDFGSAADYELMLRYLERFKVRSSYVPETIVTMRAGGMSGGLWTRLWRHKVYDSRAWKVNHLGGGFFPAWAKFFRKIPQLFT